MVPRQIRAERAGQPGHVLCCSLRVAAQPRLLVRVHPREGGLPGRHGRLEVAVAPAVVVHEVCPQVVGAVDQGQVLVRRVQRMPRHQPLVQVLPCDQLHGQSDPVPHHVQVGASPRGQGILPEPQGDHAPRQLLRPVRGRGRAGHEGTTVAGGVELVGRHACVPRRRRGDRGEPEGLLGSAAPLVHHEQRVLDLARGHERIHRAHAARSGCNAPTVRGLNQSPTCPVTTCSAAAVAIAALVWKP